MNKSAEHRRPTFAATTCLKTSGGRGAAQSGGNKFWMNATTVM